MCPVHLKIEIDFLQLVKNWLNDGVPARVILETIYELESFKKEE